MSDLFGKIDEVPVGESSKYEMSLGLLEAFGRDKDGKAMGEIYENHVPKISLDVEAAVIGMRSSATGGIITT